MSNPPPVSEAVRRLLTNSAVACRDWAEQELGPYHLDRPPARRDVSEDRPGAVLVLGLALVSAEGSPLPATEVEIWHCDASGVYSGFPPAGFPGLEGPATPEHLPGRTFLRGVQESDDQGMVEFHTIYPGWYPGRTVHIHVIARLAGRVFTSQLYFPDPLSDEVFATAAYAGRPRRDTSNTTDVIFPTGGDPAVLEVSAEAEGYMGGARLHLPVDG